MDEICERYRRLYSGVVYDALYYDIGYRKRFVLDRGIGWQAGRCPLVGPAFTCWGTRDTVFTELAEVVDDRDRMRLEVFEAIQPGDVVVMDTDNDATVAHFGGITAQIFEMQEAAGVVIDGYTRDIAAIDLPLFCRGTQPQDAYGKWSLQRHSEPVQFRSTGGSRITVHPGDVVFADQDGVLVVPKDLAGKTLRCAEQRFTQELAIVAALAGETPREVYERLGRW